MLSTRTVLSLGGFYTLASTIQTIPFNWSYRSKQLKQKSFLQKISFWLLTLWYIINAIYISVILIDSAFLRKETSTSLSDLTVNILFLTFYVTCSAAFTKTSYYAYELENLPGQLVKNSEALKKQFIPENYRRTKCQLDYFNWVIIQIINCSVFIWSFPIAFQFVLDPTNVRYIVPFQSGIFDQKFDKLRWFCFFSYFLFEYWICTCGVTHYIFYLLNTLIFVNEMKFWLRQIICFRNPKEQNLYDTKFTTRFPCSSFRIYRYLRVQEILFNQAMKNTFIIHFLANLIFLILCFMLLKQYKHLPLVTVLSFGAALLMVLAFLVIAFKQLAIVNDLSLKFLMNNFYFKPDVTFILKKHYYNTTDKAILKSFKATGIHWGCGNHVFHRNTLNKTLLIGSSAIFYLLVVK